VRGSAKSLHPLPAAAPEARPSSPSNTTSTVHCIPHSSQLNPASVYSSPDHSTSGELRSPRLGQAALMHSKSKRQSSKGRREGGEFVQASGQFNESRVGSAKPASTLSSKHAHSILHTHLIQGPPSPDRPRSPSHPLDSPGRPSQGQAEPQPSSAPFRGFASPSMTSNEMQVRALGNFPSHLPPLFLLFRLSVGCSFA
jgi:hypothetical protein